MILSLDTATNICSVALHTAQGELQACYEVFIEKSHTSALGTLVHQAMQLAGNELQAIAVSAGPGSYTGLRLGVSTAKGLCYGWNLPFIAVDSLESMAAMAVPLVPANAMICPMIDARRMEVYRALFDVQRKRLLETEAHVLHEGSLQPWASERPVYLVGNGAQKAYDLLKHAGDVHILGNIHTSAKGVGMIAAEKLAQQSFEDLAYFEPFYLKEYQAIVGQGHKLLRNL